MKKNCFKITAAVLSVLMLLPMLAACGAVEDIGDSISGIFDKSTPIENFSRAELSNGEGYVITDYNDKEMDVVIPEKYKGEKIVSIGAKAFQYSDITSVTIPDTVTSIGNNAFEGCDNLVSVTIPDSVTSIGEEAFYHCENLQSVTIGNSVTSIGDGAFFGCEGLTSITIPDSVESIGSSAFVVCKGLTSVTFGNGVTSIGDYAFSGCQELTKVTIGNGVTSVGNNAFRNCTGLTSVTIPKGVTRIGEEVFWNCGGLTSISFNGTIAEWKAIEKENFWKSNTGNFTVTCTDGKLDKYGNSSIFD